MDTRDALDREAQRFELPHDAFERQLRRRDRKQRNRRVSAVALVIVLTALSVTGLVRAFGAAERPATVPTPTPADRGIFSGMGGWIAYADWDGIWAVDPDAQGVPSPVSLSSELGEPLEWSHDGSKLLIMRSGHSLSVLHADGTETLVIDVGGGHGLSGGSFSPNGSQVVYASSLLSGLGRDAIFVIGADGGSPHRLLSAGRRTGLYDPAFSPDGREIAYFDGLGDSSNSLRVMNADGSGSHIVLADNDVMGNGAGSKGIEWSPDGSLITFDFRALGIFVVRPDGSGFERLIRGNKPHWSPDGSRISYQQHDGPLRIAAADGTFIRTIDIARAGPWNPTGTP